MSNKYKNTVEYAYRKLVESSCSDKDEMNEEDEGMEDELFDSAESIQAQFIEEFTENLIETLREFAMISPAEFSTNKDKLFKELEGILNKPIFRDMTAKVLARQEEEDIFDVA